MRCRFTANNAGFEDLAMGILHFWPLGFLGILAVENVSWWSWGAGSTANTAGFGDLTIGILHFWPLGPPGNDSIICVLIFFCGLHLLLYILSSNAFAHFGLAKCMLVILRSRFHCKEWRFWRPYNRDLTFWVLRIPGKSGIGKCKLMISRCRFHCK